MKSEKLLRAIGEIDDSFIEEADVQAAANTGIRRRRRNITAIAASIAVVVIAGVMAVNGSFSSVQKSINTTPTSYRQNDSAPMPTANTTESFQGTAETTSNNASPAPSEDSRYTGVTVASNEQVEPNAAADKHSGHEMTDYEFPGSVIANQSIKPDISIYRGISDSADHLHLGFPGVMLQEWLSEKRSELTK